ncbi:MAG: hypothetical protein FWF20_09190 [Betaproteobacteria bacterium]|nr:hypothetical protein [Betaproteobacteria bacterium]MCL2886937.1 hypothetical protein [Betaproteobacteria bacterium]
MPLTPERTACPICGGGGCHVCAGTGRAEGGVLVVSEQALFEVERGVLADRRLLDVGPLRGGPERRMPTITEIELSTDEFRRYFSHADSVITGDD